MNKIIKAYNEEFVTLNSETQKIVIKEFSLKTSEEKKEKKAKTSLKNGVRVSNLDFDIDEKELKKLAVDFGEVNHIEMNLR